MYTAWLRYTNTTEQYFTRGCVPTGADRNRIGDCGFDIRYAMGHVLLLSCCAPPLEAAVDEARELGRELGRRLVHEDIPAGQQGGVDLQG